MGGPYNKSVGHTVSARNHLTSCVFNPQNMGGIGCRVYQATLTLKFRWAFGSSLHRFNLALSIELEWNCSGLSSSGPVDRIMHKGGTPLAGMHESCIKVEANCVQATGVCTRNYRIAQRQPQLVDAIDNCTFHSKGGTWKTILLTGWPL